YISESNKCKERKIFVNVERKQLFDERFCCEAEAIIRRINALNTQIVLEVTERGEADLSDWKLFREIKKRYDFELAADDVKNVKDVRKLEIDFGVYDYVKMEPFFLEGSAAYSRETTVDTINWMFNLIHNFGLKFIAEMIESKEILEEAKKYPFSHFQGYYFKSESIK
uniref:EAL domain-containing protein n=1 Tax=Vibrio jasicida TaxID=766224 RepID=UPI0011B0246D